MPTRLIAALTLFLVCTTARPVTAGNKGSPGTGLDEELLSLVRLHGVVLTNGNYYVFTEVSPSTSSSMSIRAAEGRAALEAKLSLARHLATLQIPGDIASERRDVLVPLLMNNFDVVYKLAQVVSRSGFDDKTAWALLTVPEQSIEVSPVVNFPRLLQGLMASNVVLRTDGDADIIFETAATYDILSARRYWMASLPKSLADQLGGNPLKDAFRLWIDGESRVLAALSLQRSLPELKRLMAELPFSQDVNTTLADHYYRQGLTNCAETIRLKYTIPTTSDQNLRVLDEKAFNDANRSTDIGHPLIRVVLASKGCLPVLEEPIGTNYQAALAVYMRGDMEAAKAPAWSALEQSINADTLNLYGAVMRRSGFPALGAVLCRQAFACRPSHPYALVNLALSFEVMGNVDAARCAASAAMQKAKLDTWGRTEATRLAKGLADAAADKTKRGIGVTSSQLTQDLAVAGRETRK